MQIISKISRHRFFAGKLLSSFLKMQTERHANTGIKSATTTALTSFRNVHNTEKGKPVIGMLSVVEGMVEEARKELPDHVIERITLKKAEENTVSENDFNDNVKQLDRYKVLLADAGLLGPYMNSLKNVEWVQFDWAGIDGILKYFENTQQRPCFRLTRFGGYFGAHMAEYILSNIINLERRAFHFYELQKKCQWEAATYSIKNNYRLLKDLSILILGVGSIGREVAQKCKCFGMTVYGLCSKIPENKEPAVDEYIKFSKLTDYLKKADYVCNILPSTPATKGILSGDILQNCESRKSYFINIGRGNIIDDNSLLNALEKGWLAGAVLDVFNKEPLPSNHKLWRMDNVIITPHVSGLSFPNEVIGCFKENLKLYESGQPLQYEVQWSRYY